jgi:hypothetical protein
MKKQNKDPGKSKVRESEPELIRNRAACAGPHGSPTPLELTLAKLSADPCYSSHFNAPSVVSGKGGTSVSRKNFDIGLPVPGNLYSPRGYTSSRKQFKKWLDDGKKARIINNMDVLTIPEKIITIGKYHLGMNVDTPSIMEIAERKTAKLDEMTNSLKGSMEKLEQENINLDNYAVNIIDDTKRHNDEFIVSNMLRQKYRSDMENVMSTISGVPHYSDSRVEAMKVILYAQRAEKKATIDCIINLHKRNLREMEFDRLKDIRQMLQSTQIGIATSVAEGDILMDHMKTVLPTYEYVYNAVAGKLKQDQYAEKTRKDLSLLDRHFAKAKQMLYERTKQSLSEEGSRFFVESENK